MRASRNRWGAAESVHDGGEGRDIAERIGTAAAALLPTIMLATRLANDGMARLLKLHGNHSTHEWVVIDQQDAAA